MFINTLFSLFLFIYKSYSMNLNNLKLVQDKAFVNGEWINALSNKTLQSQILIMR
jgi:hypothetical protein